MAKTEKKKRKNLVARVNGFILRLQMRIAQNKKKYIIYSILRFLVLLVLIRSLIDRNYESAMNCLLSLILFLLPSFFESNFKVEIPTLFEIIIYCFIFAAEILGEINHFYVLIPGWDTMLHTLNGFLCAAVGFSLIDLMNRHSEHMGLSPKYLTLVAFCFSMTIGVLWEFFEYGIDHLALMDMQKDFIVSSFGSVTLDPEGQGSLVRVKDIVQTTILTASGETYVIDGGYLDIGIKDTMKDLFVNFLGAIVFCIIGYFYVRDREKKSIAPSLMMRPLTEEEIERDNEIDPDKFIKERQEKFFEKKEKKRENAQR